MPDGFDPGRAWTSANFADAVSDAEMLMTYVSSAGMAMPETTIAALARAREAVLSKTMTEDVVVKFYEAFAAVAAKAAPVTTDTLRVSDTVTRRNLRWNGAFAIALALIVVIFSGISFVTVSMSADIENGISHANELAVKLRSQVGAPAAGDVDQVRCGEPIRAPVPEIQFTDQTVLVSELQDFAADIRTLLRNASKLNFFVLYQETSPLDTQDGSSMWKTNANAMVQLDPGLVNMRKEAFCKISAYETVRDFGQAVRTDTLAFYGAITAYLLPVLYALSGAFAFNLRDFSERVVQRTYRPTSYTSTARTIAAMTVGAIISLFNVFSRDTALQPLALAFLAGYGVEVFFAFLNSLLTTFGSRKLVPVSSL